MHLTANQIVATRPEISARVMANAGAGKTSVLTTRVLRLLLNGTAPSKILCLTYTKAAAAEMNERVNSRLQSWALMEDDALAKDLRDLIEVQPNAAQIKVARMLFSRTLESMPPPRIQTIHSFCQEVLKRFPLESGVQPYFKVIDDLKAEELLKETKQRLLINRHDPRLMEAIDFIAAESGEWKFSEIVDEIIGQRNKIKDLLKSFGSAENLTQHIYEKEGLQPDDNSVELHMEFEEAKFAVLNDLLAVFGNSSGKTDNKNYEILSAAILDKNFASYKSVYLTKENEKRAQVSVISKKAIAEFIHGWEWIEAEQEALLALQDKVNMLDNLEYTAHVINLAEALIAIYEGLKRAESVLDYNDLIFYTRNLLTSVSATSWVLYKLDGGLEHILIDEAQDTSPEQWQIVMSLVDEFLSGEGSAKRERTVFIVGDEKQSIYSFQGADQKAFAAITDLIRERCLVASMPFMDIRLETSFRSIDSILKLADNIFQDEFIRESVTSVREISHELNRVGEGGKAEIWPLVESGERVALENWQLPLSYVSERNAEWILAEKITDTIAGWIDDQRVLASTGQPIRPSDILILLKSRGEMADLLIRKLKRKNIEVAGSDRLKITGHIAVKDLIALANFLLLPSDDLSLACVLKSPLFGITEEELFELCYKRDNSIWARIISTTKYNSLYYELKQLIDKADYVSIYELYSFVLDQMGGRKKFIARLGHEVNDVLDEFLDLALNFERGHTNSIQHFTSWICNAQMEIKRDKENAADEVRIMTIHGSKGLEAPIVILADTAKLPQSKEQLIWDDGLFYCYKTKSQLGKTLKSAFEKTMQADYDEYLRLLYVAITRARDELYVAGAVGEKKRDIEKSWYNIVLNAMKLIGVEDSESGNFTHITKQEKEISVKSRTEKRAKPQLPAFLSQKLPVEKLRA